ncbi:MAG TPA: pseudouridine synthase [Terriglobales bacterium]
MPQERLQKIISAAGIASRRAAEELITTGQVSVNGNMVTELGAKADVDSDRIEVRGKPIRVSRHHMYLMMNKPRGYVTTVSDPEGRPTVMDLLPPDCPRVYPVGRLDYGTEGLLLFTNDGDLAYKLTKASSHVPKTYLVKVSGNPTEEELDKLRHGVRIPKARVRDEEGAGGPRVKTAPARIRWVRHADNPWLEVSLIEGKNRQIRKMFEEVGHHVEKIRRIAYGPIELSLETGAMRSLKLSEVAALKQAVGMGKGAGEAEEGARAARVDARRFLPKQEASRHEIKRPSRSERPQRAEGERERSVRPERDRGARPERGREATGFGGSRERRPFDRAPSGDRGRSERGGRPHGDRAERGGARGDRPARGARPQGDRPARTPVRDGASVRGDRDSRERSGGYGQRRPQREGGDRPQRSFGGGDRGAQRSGDRAGGGRPPFRRDREGAPSGERPGRPPFRRDREGAPSERAGARPPFRRDREGSASGERPAGRPPYRRDREGAPSGERSERRPPYRGADRGGEGAGRRPPFRRDREEGGEGRPAARGQYRGDRNPRASSGRASGERTSRERPLGERPAGRGFQQRRPEGGRDERRGTRPQGRGSQSADRSNSRKSSFKKGNGGGFRSSERQRNQAVGDRRGREGQAGAGAKRRPAGREKRRDDGSTDEQA